MLLDRSIEVLRYLKHEIASGTIGRDALVERLLEDRDASAELGTAEAPDADAAARSRAREQLLVWVDLARRLYA